MDSRQAEQYLERIGFSEQPGATPENLVLLQKAHLLAVPFENLDIHRGVPITIDSQRIFNKVVSGKRGGFCFELNSLFGSLLRHLGFDITQLAAQVHAEKTGYGLPFSHLTLGVSFENHVLLSDVGFGEFSFAPLKLQPGKIHQDERGVFKIEQDITNRWEISKKVGEQFSPEYAFHLQHRELHEFNHMCRYHQTSQDSSFTQKRLISRPVEGGRVTITNNTLVITSNNQHKETTLASEADFNAALWTYFRIYLNS